MPVKKKVVCTSKECEGKNTEVELMDGEGTCSVCGLDMGWVVEKARRDDALERFKGGVTPPKKKRVWD